MNMKAEWAKMPDSYFEALTFGELEVGQTFIGLPSPGDNDGHGGFKGVHCIFTKTHQHIANAAPGLPYGIPHGQAIDDQRNPNDFPNSMPVILVQ